MISYILQGKKITILVAFLRQGRIIYFYVHTNYIHAMTVKFWNILDTGSSIAHQNYFTIKIPKGLRITNYYIRKLVESVVIFKLKASFSHFHIIKISDFRDSDFVKQLN